jgi:4-hydroxy-tetrahydrodipicolinate synthase
LNPTYAGVVGAPVTPFKADNSLDLDTFAKQINFLIENGVRLIAHPMHIGESVNMTDPERKELMRVTVQAAGGRVPVFVHVSHAGTDLAIDLASHAAKVGATGIVLMPPYHWRSGDEAILEHYRAVSAAGPGKMIVYHNPKATNITMMPGVLPQVIDKVPGIVAIKDATFHMETFTDVCELIASSGKDIAVYTGIEFLLTSIPVGGAGCFSAISEVAPGMVSDLFKACMRADYQAARTQQYKTRRMLKVVMHNYPATIKHCMELMGRPVGTSRRPILPPTPEEKAWAASELKALGVLDNEPRGWSKK